MLSEERREHDIAIATITWARSPADEVVLTRALTVLLGLGLPTAIADRGDTPSFTQRLGELHGARVSVPTRADLVEQVRCALAIAAAFERPWLLYTEPDKEAFFQRGLRDFIARAPLDDNVGIVIAGRSDESFATYPPMQRYTEGVANHLCESVIGASGDYFYGPFLFRRTLLPALGTMEGLGWGWRPYAFHAAARQGLGVAHVTGDFPCPVDQRDEGARDRAHRMRQLSQNIVGLLA